MALLVVVAVRLKRGRESTWRVLVGFLRSVESTTIAYGLESRGIVARLMWRLLNIKYAGEELQISRGPGTYAASDPFRYAGNTSPHPKQGGSFTRHQLHQVGVEHLIFDDEEKTAAGVLRQVAATLLRTRGLRL